MPYTFNPAEYDIASTLANRGITPTQGLLGAIAMAQNQPTVSQPAQTVQQDNVQDQQAAVQTPQIQQPTANDTINQAVANGAQQAATQHAQAQSINNAVQRGARTMTGLLGGIPQSRNEQEQAQLEFLQGLLGYKDSYATAQAAGDQQGMKDAAEGANTLREMAQRAGINLDNVYAGADNTRAQLAAAINGMESMRYGRLMGSVDSGTYYDNVYNNAIANGASRRVAQRYARQEAAKYQAQRLADLSLALQDRGISHQGFLNAAGAQILAKMYDEDPNGMAQVYNTYFGKPVNLGTWELAEMSQDSADKRQRGQMTLTEQLQEALSNNNTSNTMKVAAQQIDWNRELANLQAALSREQMQNMKDMSYHKDDAAVSAAQYKGSSQSSSSKSSSTSTDITGKPKGMSDSVWEGITGLDNKISRTIAALSSPTKDNDGDGTKLEDARTTMEDLYDKGKIDKDTYTNYYSRIRELENLYNTKYGYEPKY